MKPHAMKCATRIKITARRNKMTIVRVSLRYETHSLERGAKGLKYEGKREHLKNKYEMKIFNIYIFKKERNKERKSMYNWQNTSIVLKTHLHKVLK